MVELESSSLRLEEALLRLDRVAVKAMLEEAAKGARAFELVDEIVVPALQRMGEGWERGTVALSQTYMSARILEDLLPIVLPLMQHQGRPQPRMAIVLLRDYHALGKRIVTSALMSSGFSLTDYGRMDVDDLVARALKDRVEMLLVSTLMLPSALAVKHVRSRFDEAGGKISLVVGGAPFRLDKALWREVGADAMGSNAAEAVAIVTEMARSVS